MLIKYWKPLAVAAVLAMSFVAGKTWEDRKRDIADLEWQLEYTAEIIRQTTRADDLAKKLLDTERKRNEYLRKLRNQTPQIIERTVYSNQCIDDDGRVLLNGYLAGKELPSSGIDGGVPPADSAGR